MQTIFENEDHLYATIDERDLETERLRLVEDVLEIFMCSKAFVLHSVRHMTKFGNEQHLNAMCCRQY